LKGRAKFKRRDAAPTSRDIFAGVKGANDEIVTAVGAGRPGRTRLIPETHYLRVAGQSGTAFAI